MHPSRIYVLTNNFSSPSGWGWVARVLGGKFETLRVSADPWALKCPKILVKRPRMLKSATFACTPVTLRHPNLSHIDFLDNPAAIHSSRTPISDATKREPKRIDASRDINEKPSLFSYIVFLGLGLQSSLPSNIFSCLYSIAL